MDYIYKLQTRRKCMQDKFSIGCNNVIFVVSEVAR